MKRFFIIFGAFIGFCYRIESVELRADEPVIAILREDFPEKPSHADPVELHAFLQSKGMNCQYVSADILANREEFNTQRFALVLLPYGACFPLQAREAFVQFLKQGGAFISMGGYAFDDLMEKKEGKWDKVDTDDPNLFLSGRRGKPGDWVRFQPDQIVIFDPTFPFKRADRIRSVQKNEFHISLEGFPAVAMTGNNSPVFGKPYARWYSLANAYDKYNQNRGSVFALTFQYDGPYQGSAWAFSGITNVNLFSAVFPAMLDLLEQAVKAIQTRTFPGDGEFKKQSDSKTVKTDIQGVPQSEKRGVAITYFQNYFHMDGQPTFLMGTNQTGIVWSSSNENRETWNRDLELMKRHGLSILRVLHFSPFALEENTGGRGVSPLQLAKEPPQSLIRKTDDLVAVCAEHRIALMLTLHDWMLVELTEEELQAQRIWARYWANRYRDQKHVLFDIQNEPSIAPEKTSHVQELWNVFLQGQYSEDTRLKAAWGKFAGNESLGTILCEPGEDRWENPRVYDFNRFRSWLTERWIQANMAGIREGAPEKPATVGFLQYEWPADKFLPTSDLTFSNTHYHGPFDRFSAIFKLTDRRFRGQGLSVGEFGAWDAHQARSRGEFRDETEASIRHFLAVGHDTLGMGGSLMMNWDLKDLDECVFPWGLTYMQQGQSVEDAVPKDWLDAYGKMSLLFSGFRPQYEPPELFFVIPDNHRLGAKSRTIHEALHNALNWLFACHVNFGVINEKAIGELPPEARALIWPIPYCSDDDVFETIAQWIENGGHLYFSGGIGFDPYRRPTRSERYQRLGLPPQEDISPFEANNRAEKRDWVTAGLGKGTIYYMPAPIELVQLENLAENPYKEFVSMTGVSTIEAIPDDPKLHIFSIPETNGNRIYTLFRNEKDSNPKAYTLKTPHGTLQVSLKGTETGLAQIDAQGRLMAVEGTGDILWNERVVLKTDAHAMVISRDRIPLADSRAIWILPTRPGEMQIAMNDTSSLSCTIGRWFVNREDSQSIPIGNAPLPFTVRDSNVCLPIDEDAAVRMILLGHFQD